MLEDPSQHSMVRHEAGEALGAICSEQCLVPLRAHMDDPCREVAETCQLAIQRLEYFADRKPDTLGEKQDDDEVCDSSPYISVDPTPPAPASVPMDELRATLLDESVSRL